MWKLADIHSERTYCVQLCQDSERKRRFRLRELPDGEANADRVFETFEVPRHLLVSCNFERMADEVRLVNGKRFYVDAHGVWLTEEEYLEVRASKLDWSDIPWATGVSPKLPPR